MSRIDDLLLPTFVAQHGLIAADQVSEAGGQAHHISSRLAAGRWERADECVYRLVGLPTSWRTRLLAPILSAGAPAMASHLSAAVLHGIPGFKPGTAELSVVRGTKFRRPGLRVHTSTDLDRCVRQVVDGIPVTDPARTILDIARVVGDQRLLRCIEWARRNEKTDWPALIATLAAHARRGRPGVQRLRRILLANAHRDEVTDSDLELLALAVMLEHGLPEPELHYRVFDGVRFVAEVDYAFVGPRVAVELDGPAHLEPEVRELDLRKQNDLQLVGWRVLRFTRERLTRSPARFIGEIRTAIGDDAPHGQQACAL